MESPCRIAEDRVAPIRREVRIAAGWILKTRRVMLLKEDLLPVIVEGGQRERPGNHTASCRVILSVPSFDDNRHACSGRRFYCRRTGMCCCITGLH